MNTVQRLLAFLVLLAPLQPVHAQVELAGGRFTLIGSPTSGGGAMTQDDISVRSAVGAPVTRPSTGGRFTLTPGFDTLVVPLTGHGGVLKITGLPDGRGLLEWTDEADGFLLESTSDPGPNAVWERVEVPEGSTRFVIPKRQTPGFYRLRKP